MKVRRYEGIADLLMDLDAPLCHRLLNEVLPRLSLLDPACGSGAFLVAAMKTLINVYSAVIGKIKFLNNPELSAWLAKTEREHKSIAYFIKKRIITDNLYGVDIMEEASEIARLRLFLALVASADSVDQLEPLPNVDFNILAGNSLIGLMRVDDKEFERRNAQGNLFRKSYKELLEEKDRLIDTYRHATAYAEDLTDLRDRINKHKDAARATLDEILLDQFKDLGIKYEQATWDEKKGEEGKPVKRPLMLDDIRHLDPFHWGYEFDKVLHGRGGFDAIVTNPPWEVLKPYAKEFFEEHSELVTKLFMRVEDFEREKAKLLKNAAILSAWLDYLSQYPHQSAWFRSVPQYKNQISVINGRKAGTDINFYKLFLEQCFNLLRSGGRCGILTPGSVYNDLGAKQLREMLFGECEVDSLFGLTNERFLFEGLDHRFKICILAFGKGGKTRSFPVAFRIQPREAVTPEGLDAFFHNHSEHLMLTVDLIRKLSPDSSSLMEFKNMQDAVLAEKLSRFPLLGEQTPASWSVRFTREFDMHNDSYLFETAPTDGRLPLYEGKMIHQFEHRFGEPKYWLDECRAHKALLGREEDVAQELPYQDYRLGFRDVASNTNARTAIMTMLPPNVFCPHTLPTAHATPCGSQSHDHRYELFLCALINSIVVDFLLRNALPRI